LAAAVIAVVTSAICAAVLVVPRMGVFCVTAWREMPRIMWMPNFSPLAWT